MRAEESRQAQNGSGTSPRQRGGQRRPIDCGADAPRMAAAHDRDEVTPETAIPARGCCTEETRTSGRAARTHSGGRGNAGRPASARTRGASCVCVRCSVPSSLRAPGARDSTPSA